MADLFDRLFKYSGGGLRLAPISLIGAITDYIYGHTTRQQVIDFWEFEVDLEVDLNALLNNIDKLFFKSRKHRYLLEIIGVINLGTCNLKYLTKVEFKTRLGI